MTKVKIHLPLNGRLKKNNGMGKIIIFFLALSSTAWFLNAKFSQAVRVIAFQEQEPKNEAIANIILLFVCVCFWVAFYTIIS